MKPTHFKNKSGYVVPANKWMHQYWKELELEPVYMEPEKDVEREKQEEVLRAHTVTELRAKAKEKGLSGYSKMNEAELIDLLLGV